MQNEVSNGCKAINCKQTEFQHYLGTFETMYNVLKMTKRTENILLIVLFTIC